MKKILGLTFVLMALAIGGCGQGTPVTLVASNVARADPDIHKNDEYWGGITLNFHWAEWEPELNKAGNWYVYVLYASDESRPGKLTINGNVKAENIVGDKTGGFHAKNAKWTKYGPYGFNKGKNIVRLEFTGAGPHIKGFYFTQSADAAPSAETFGK